MGMLSGSIPWYTMMVLHKKIPMLKRVDDTMAVFHTHAVAGSLGGILAGFFANPKLNRIFYLVDDWEHYIGLAYGFQSGRASAGFRQMGVQLLGISFVIALNIFTTSENDDILFLRFFNFPKTKQICVLIRIVVPLRLTDEELQTGDDAIHGEEAYALWGDGEKYESRINSAYGAEDFPPAVSKGELEMA
ncbi:hypothetical protein WN944_018546 [Citrus x changshan-huyou]|uniref:Ammonium transporter AmtB-like domain-containing protein n=1 Tax=Citrus x changshan-huyou TaxID=2935761 RepID=A0AAP0LTW9_9ROSI